MPRTAAQDEWRKKHKQLFAQVAVTEATKAEWKAYAQSKNLPMGTMIRQCIARCMELDGWTYEPETKEE
ncbi:MAG: hypothetical protein IJ461_04280 [Clostridia bacterium]|nr:hypothetical protein [Clostridia bacterium]